MPTNSTINVLDYSSLVVSGDWTAAVNQAILDAKATAKSVHFPGSTQPYMCGGQIVVLEGVHLFGDGPKMTIIKRIANSSNTAQVALRTDAYISDLAIDGNAAQQTADCYGVVGYQAQGMRVERILVTDTFGIGVGWSECAHAICSYVEVKGVKNGKPGFWNDTTQPPTAGHGYHSYNYCSATDCELDGIIVGCDDVTINGGTYSHNGYGAADYHGALGAAGIFGTENRTLQRLSVRGAVCNENSEFGINFSSDCAIIQGNECRHNQLAGIQIRSGRGSIISGNSCVNNGWYTGSLNPDLWFRAGIVFYASTTATIISGNICINDGTIAATQQWGIRFASAPAGTSTLMVVEGNATRYNLTDNDNINPSGYPQTKLGLLKYGDNYNGDQPTRSAVTAAPDVAGGYRVVRLAASQTVTDLAGGAASQFVTLYASTTGCIIKNNSKISTRSGSDLPLAAGKAVTFAYIDGLWREV